MGDQVQRPKPGAPKKVRPIRSKAAMKKTNRTARQAAPYFVKKFLVCMKKRGVASESMDPIVHFELPVTDLDAARKFYGPIFDWTLQDWPMPDGSIYIGVHTTPIDEKTREPLKPGGINGGIMKKNDKVKAPVFAIKVSSIDEKMKMVEKAGGKVVMPKMDMMGMGYYAYFADPSGNVVGLWEDASKK